jgi:hypothetical protein
MTLKKTRRIEITAFRRTTRISSDVPEFDLSEPFSREQNDELLSTDAGSPRIEQLDVVEVVLSSADDQRSPECPQLIEKQVVSGSDSRRTAEHRGRSRNGFYSQLRSFGLSVKNLKPIGSKSLTKEHKSQ